MFSPLFSVSLHSINAYATVFKYLQIQHVDESCPSCSRRKCWKNDKKHPQYVDAYFSSFFLAFLKFPTFQLA